MNKHEATQKMHQEFMKTLQETIFPDEQLPPTFTGIKHAVLQHCSFGEVQLPFLLYKCFMMKTREYNLWEVCTVVNLFQKKTLAELTPLLHRDYYSVLGEIMELEKVWNAIVNPIRETMQRKFDIMVTPPGMRKPGMKIITN